MGLSDYLKEKVLGRESDKGTEERKTEKKVEDNKETKEKAIRLLESPGLLHRIKKTLDRGFIVDKYRSVVDEDRNKLLTFLIGVSAKTEYPQFEWVKGKSGCGKTNLVKTVLHLFPRGYVKEMAHFTPGALRHSEDNYEVLYLQEFKKNVEEDLRLVSNQDGSYSFEIAVRKDGRWTTEERTIPAKTLITTSVRFNATTQMKRRCWKVSMDESQELTDEINRKKSAYRKRSIEPVSKERVKAVRKSIELLDPREVIIPYSEEVRKLYKWDRSHIDFFYDLISIICILHQHQRHVNEEGELIATSEDLYHALRIVWPNILIESLLNMPDRLKKYVASLEEHERGSAKDLAERMDKDESTIRGAVSELAELGLVSKQKDGRRKSYVLKGGDWVLQHLKWEDIASMVKRKENKLFSGSVENNSDTRKKGIIDPITGENRDLLNFDEDSILTADKEREQHLQEELKEESSDSNLQSINQTKVEDGVPIS